MGYRNDPFAASFQQQSAFFAGLAVQRRPDSSHGCSGDREAIHAGEPVDCLDPSTVFLLFGVVTSATKYFPLGVGRIMIPT
jgi:hypothetical protein